MPVLDVGGEIAHETEEEDDGGEDPERPIEVGRQLGIIKEVLSPWGEGPRDPPHHLALRHVEVRLVVLEAAEGAAPRGRRDLRVVFGGIAHHVVGDLLLLGGALRK